MEEIIHESSTEIRMTKEEAKEICRIGQGEKCCAFLTYGPPNGFECVRMSYPANSSIFKRLEKGTMNCKGHGRWKGCPWNEENNK